MTSREDSESEKHLRVTHKHSEGVFPKSNKTRQLQRTEPKGKEGLLMMARRGDLKELSEPNAVFYVLLYKDNFLVTNDLPPTLPSVVFGVLQDYEDVFPEEVPSGLPLKRDRTPNRPCSWCIASKPCIIPHQSGGKKRNLAPSTRAHR
jgi:hypothetical protein